MSSSKKGMSFGLAAIKFKLQTQIAGLERRKKLRQEQFGIEYIKLATSGTKKSEARACLQRAVNDMDEVNQDIEDCYTEIERRTAEEETKRSQQPEQKPQSKRKGKKPDNNERDLDSGPSKGKTKSNGGDINPKQRRGREAGRGSGRGHPGSRGQDSGGRGPGGPGGPGRGRGRNAPSGRGGGPGGRGRGAPVRRRKQAPISPGAIARNPQNRLPKRVADRDRFQPRHSPEGKRSRLSAVNLSLAPGEFKPGSNIQKWTHSEWKFREYKTNGGWSKTTEGLVEKCPQNSVQRGIEKFKAHPQLFIAMMYPTEMLTWPVDEQEYTLIYRAGTTGLKPKGVSPRGQVTFLMHEYQPLPSFPKDDLPKKSRDDFTDKMTYRGQKLVTKQLPAYLPGRGTGLLDDPRLKIIGDIDPSDIAQGQVGDCWLLSGVASLAEFDGSIQRLFRKTKDLDQMPFADGRPNVYTVTLWDLPTWSEVDIVVDERLCARKDIKGALFGAKATEDGELWLCYLEKAIAAHCGGWDKIDGGQCTHAWSLLTGCKEQFIIQRIPEAPDKGPFGIWAKYDTTADRWAKHGNSPTEGQQGVWRVPWPELGGGGDYDLDEDDLFFRMCQWSDCNYLIGASSKGDSDRNSTNGVVDNHAYSVIDCRNDVAGTGFDMIQVRNPWGYGTIEDGHFTRRGKGWKQYPEIKAALEYEDLGEDDGVFWATREEFFDHYHCVYLGAMDMKEFLGIPESPKAKKANHVIEMLSTPDLGSDDEDEGMKKKDTETAEEGRALDPPPKMTKKEPVPVQDASEDGDTSKKMQRAAVEGQDMQQSSERISIASNDDEGTENEASGKAESANGYEDDSDKEHSGSEETGSKDGEGMDSSVSDEEIEKDTSAIFDA